MNAAAIINSLGLMPHPEGGYFRETYRCQNYLPAHGGLRSVSTAIYFLLTGDTFSALHRLASDEVWLYHLGDPVRLHLIHPDGRHQEWVVGPELDVGQTPQVVIPAGCWFGAKVERAEGFTLVGCTVAPGFDFSDFELARREKLIQAFPQHARLITSFTRTS
jgi:predicted cupin superfamily sugar epimerase